MNKIEKVEKSLSMNCIILQNISLCLNAFCKIVQQLFLADMAEYRFNAITIETC